MGNRTSTANGGRPLTRRQHGNATKTTSRRTNPRLNPSYAAEEDWQRGKRVVHRFPSWLIGLSRSDLQELVDYLAEILPPADALRRPPTTIRRHFTVRASVFTNVLML
ncbi:hypothetical protein SDJN02_24829, partial [Cucurbita argyrosperma subsp. argyrosperma]